MLAVTIYDGHYLRVGDTIIHFHSKRGRGMKAAIFSSDKIDRFDETGRPASISRVVRQVISPEEVILCCGHVQRKDFPQQPRIDDKVNCLACCALAPPDPQIAALVR